MFLEHNGRQYSVTLGSDIERNGMFLELSEGGTDKVRMEIFYSDTDGSFVVAGFGEPLPLEIVERLIAEARAGLPPASSTA